MTHHRPDQLGAVIIGIAERIRLRLALQRIVRQRRLQMLQRDGTVEAQLLGGVAERGDGDGVVEHVVEPAEVGGAGKDVESRSHQAKIVALAWAKHHPMLAERYRLTVTVSRQMADGEDRHEAIWM
jgi:hypothetical protein